MKHYKLSMIPLVLSASTTFCMLEANSKINIHDEKISNGTTASSKKNLAKASGPVVSLHTFDWILQNLGKNQKLNMYRIEALRACVDKDGNSLLTIAAQKNDVANLEAFVKHEFNVNHMNNMSVTPLHLAVENVSPEMVQSLLDAGANPMISNNSSMTAWDNARSMNRYFSEMTRTTDNNREAFKPKLEKMLLIKRFMSEYQQKQEQKKPRQPGTST